MDEELKKDQNMTIYKRGLIERLNNEGVVCAEGFLFEMERRGYMSAGEFVPKVALENPLALKALHRDFQHAGSDIVQAFTYNGHREKMRVIGKESLLEPLNRSALRIAKEVANDVPQGSEPNLMAGNISNSNIWDPQDPKSQHEVRQMFEEMVGWAIEEGADMLIGETFYYAEEAYMALDVMKQAKLPCVVTVAPMADNVMLDNNLTPAQVCQELEQRGADVVGMNCFRGPPTMMPYLQAIRESVSCHVAALPVPYRTSEREPTFFNLSDYDNCACPSPHGRTFPTALDPLFTNRYEVRQFADQAFDMGCQYLGLCCGANPMLIREVAEAMAKCPPASRYSENMSRHFMYGDDELIQDHIKAHGEYA